MDENKVLSSIIKKLNQEEKDLLTIKNKLFYDNGARDCADLVKKRLEDYCNESLLHSIDVICFKITRRRKEDYRF